MSFSFLQAFLDWISQNAIWSGIIIFLIACSESLALVGLLVPGAVLMFALGTLIATGHLAFWPAVSWAVAGAIAGDGISYWLGYYYQDRLAKLWPLSHHPQLLDKGRRFFDRHGGKSVLFGRFVGPLRPIVPAIAGMAGMPLPRFIAINVVSGLAWAPLNLLPGMAFGLSLTVAGEVAGRLVVAILLFVVSVLVLLWLGKQIYQALLPRVDNMLFSLANWSRHHPIAGHIPDALIRPEHPEVRILSLLALLLLLASSLFIALLHWSGQTGLLSQFDKLLHYNLALLHNPWFDGMMGGLSAWADVKSILLFCLLSGAWLVWQHNRLALWHLLAALSVPMLLNYTLPVIFTAPEISLPAATVLLATSVYGFIAVVLVRELALRYHMTVYLLVAGQLFVISFAALYLQYHSLSEIVGGLCLGSIWVAILGIAYRRHVHQPYVKPPALLAFGLVYLICLLTIMPAMSSQKPVQTPEAQTTFTAETWSARGWRQLATRRNDIRYRQNHPLNIQWVGDLPTIEGYLLAIGWQVPVSAQSLNLLQWFNPKPLDRDLPLLPQVHDGQYDVLRLIRFDGGEVRFLRLWRTNTTVQVGQRHTPLWLGSVGRLYRQQIMGLTLLRTSTDYAAAAGRMRQELVASQASVMVESRLTQLNGHDSEILLLNNN